MPEHVACNLCGADDTTPLFSLRDYRLRVDDVMWTAVRCRHCGLGYLNPRPTVIESARYYPESYFDHRGDQTARYRRQLRYLPQAPGRLLDIGTARGDFLVLARERGWMVEGLESAAAPTADEQLTIHRLSFPEQADALGAARFDVITAWAVFEHLRDPRGAFEACARLLPPGGRLIVQVPNLRSIHARLALQEDIPRHLYFYSRSALRRLGADAGLRLSRFHHTTDLFGGSGRGVLRLALIRAMGGSTDDFFEIWRTPRRERFRRWPRTATLWTGASAVERVLLSDWLVRSLRISGQIVAEFERTPAWNGRPAGNGLDAGRETHPAPNGLDSDRA